MKTLYISWLGSTMFHEHWTAYRDLQFARGFMIAFIAIEYRQNKMQLPHRRQLQLPQPMQLPHRRQLPPMRQLHRIDIIIWLSFYIKYNVIFSLVFLLQTEL